MEGLARYFDLKGRGTTVAIELRGAVTTFLTMAYILFVNPSILKDAGVPAEYVPGPGLIHGFAGFLGVVDAAEASLGMILASLGRVMRNQAAST